MEFGTDFSFIGNQYRLMVDDVEDFIDLLLYNRKLQAMIAIELKIGEFKPEYKRKMEFYLNDTVKLPHKNPIVGIITYNLSTDLREAYKNYCPHQKR